MDVVPASEFVRPRPGLPKTIGAFHLVIGGFLFLAGLVFLQDIGPSIAQNQPATFEPDLTQQIFEATVQQQLIQLDVREKAATDEAERARIKEERTALSVKFPKLADQVDVNAINRDLRWVTWYLWADFVSGPILNLLMLASGIGLLQLRTWARTMGAWVSALKLVRLVALTLFLVVAMIPHATHAMGVLFRADLARAVVTDMIAEVYAKRGQPVPTELHDMSQIVTVAKIVFSLLAIGMLCFGAVYPSIALVVLSRPDAKAACVPEPDSDDPGEDDS